MDLLSVIIPGYKSRFLSRTLDSVFRQSYSSFRPYLFDDASPELSTFDWGSVASRPGTSFHRFSENLGGRSLVAHWQRCVDRTEEPWVWLFSDDDLMDPGCVEAFHETLVRTNGAYDVYRFETVVIDADDRISRLNPCLPDIEGWKSFAYFLFRGHRATTVPEHIFSRRALQRIGGFVNLPLAWGSDHATVMAAAGEKGICRIPGPKIRFRWSGENLSSARRRSLDLQKLEATRLFAAWVLDRIPRVADPGFPLDDDALRVELLEWFKKHLESLRMWLTPGQVLDLTRFVRDSWGHSHSRSFSQIARLDALMIPYTLRRWLRR